MVKLYLIVAAILSTPHSFLAAKAINDPTKPKLQNLANPKSTVSKKNKKQLLTAIFLKKGNYQAIINDKLYRRGDFLGNKKIISIKSNTVLLQNELGTSQLTLISPFKKQKKN